MAQQVTITVVDDADECTSYYATRYRIVGATSWNTIPSQYGSPILISGMLDATDYEVEVTRTCCNGAVSAPRTINITTGS